MTTQLPPTITDVHTHRKDAGRDAIVNLSLDEEPVAGRYYSVGIHPWDAAGVTAEQKDRVALLAENQAVIAIGEAGIDLVHEPVAPIEEQLALLRWHIELSERLRKPLILHVVKGLEYVVGLRRTMRPVQMWIWHGFRGKQAMAEQLIAHGIHISINPARRPVVPVEIPAEYLHYETD